MVALVDFGCIIDIIFDQVVEQLGGILVEEHDKLSLNDKL